MVDVSIFDLDVSSTINIFPESRIEQPASTPLSIIDNTVANFARCAAVWYFDPPSSSEQTLAASDLQASLAKTLNFYRPWCGRLSYAKPNSNGTHTERYQRIWVTYNAPDDNGVPFITAKTHRKLSEFVPSTSERATSIKAWDASSVPSKELFPATELAISEEQDAPNVIIQFTTFSCGSTAIAIEITHCFSDAVCLSRFVSNWSLISCSMLTGAPLPIISPIFDPERLDSFSLGDIDASSPDPEIQRKARSLPQHRYDWYKQTSVPTDIPADLDPAWELSPSEPIPWEQWDTSAPCSQRVLHFSTAEIQNIYNSATEDTTEVSNTKISKHDALLAHIWKRINVARQLPEGTKAYLDMTFGLRARVNPPLPDNFLGSPITHAAITFPSPSPSSPATKLSDVATTIRETLFNFGPEEIGALLHDNAFEVAPQRLWKACLGREHVLLTTWVHSGVHEVDFVGEGGGELRYVEAVMPACDGLVVVMEARGKRKDERSWIEGGVDVTVFLESEAIGRLLDDAGLWGGVD